MIIDRHTTLAEIKAHLAARIAVAAPDEIVALRAVTLLRLVRSAQQSMAAEGYTLSVPHFLAELTGYTDAEKDAVVARLAGPPTG